jgi:hypothetical protein
VRQSGLDGRHPSTSPPDCAHPVNPPASETTFS